MCDFCDFLSWRGDFLQEQISSIYQNPLALLEILETNVSTWEKVLQFIQKHDPNLLKLLYQQPNKLWFTYLSVVISNFTCVVFKIIFIFNQVIWSIFQFYIYYFARLEGFSPEMNLRGLIRYIKRYADVRQITILLGCPGLWE